MSNLGWKQPLETFLSNLLLKQYKLQQAAQRLLLLSFEHFQEQRFHNLSRQHFAVSNKSIKQNP